ncbi:hypothetical protein A3L01_07435 [Thermococcus barossii]|uniref:Potassium channel domain-containing protein n=2 Tax=Thermococcus barossii TaxID=54077 RepID=A0A2Z2MEZ3_9EURY|nr:hypothetical protein A3L01_07435 [Thermococcus barossii]
MGFSSFKGSASFENAKFEKMAYFVNVEFMQGTDFSETKFMEGVDFSHATFVGKVNFLYAKIYKSAKFIKATFKGSEGEEVSFHGSELENANFTDTIFYIATKFGSINTDTMKMTSDTVHLFSWVVFKGQTIFKHSTFKDEVTFNHSRFDNVIFDFAVFEKEASFKNARFYGNVHFEDVEFKKIVEFQSAKFERDAIFNGSTFGKRLIFVEDDFSKEPKPKFQEKLEFSNCDFRQGVSLVMLPTSNIENAVKEIESQLKELFDFNSPNYTYSLQEAARVQRLSFEKEGKRDEADQMFVVGMRARRKIRMKEAKASGKKWPIFKAMLYNFLEWLLGDLFSNYGTGWARLLYMGLVIPLVVFPTVYAFSQRSYFGINLGFIITLGIFSILCGAFTSQFFDIWSKREARTKLIIHSTGIFGILWIVSSFCTTLNPLGSICVPSPDIMCKPMDISGPKGVLDILYYSMVTFTTLGYGDMHPTGWLKALSALEALTGAVFMALIVAVIARKWMR